MTPSETCARFVLQGGDLFVHPCREGWCPGSQHDERRTCPLYGEHAGNRMVARLWHPRPVPDWRAIPGFDNSMVLPVEIVPPPKEEP